MAEMSKRQRLRATISGEPVDRPPVAFWRHWPIDDQEPASLARATLDYQRRFDWDFLKVTPSHTFCVADYGAVHAYRGKPIGDRDHLERVIKRPEDWDRIEPLDPRKGALGRQLACLRQVVEQRPADTPVIQTVFNPIGIARYLAGDEPYLVHLRREPERLRRALEAITATTADFVRAALAEGADGIFLSTAAASFEITSPEEHDRFARPGDLTVLAAAGAGWLNVLHLHGKYPMFAQLADYPVQVVNWHDRASGPNLAEAARLFPGALAAGVEQYHVLHYGTPSDVVAQVRDAVEQTGGRRLIVAAGCTYPLTVPDGNLLAARRAVDELTDSSGRPPD
ncbi:MAG: uroporphyrinogen decarboxylase [Chloroflexi bacterium]|nr:uroporphyrinogen decarboxylase [Chloroflexota bacterium]